MLKPVVTVSEDNAAVGAYRIWGTGFWVPYYRYYTS